MMVSRTEDSDSGDSEKKVEPTRLMKPGGVEAARWDIREGDSDSRQIARS